jgi:hypothetical protein
MTLAKASLALLAVVALVGVAQADTIVDLGNGISATWTTPVVVDAANGWYKSTVSVASTTANLDGFDIAFGAIGGPMNIINERGWDIGAGGFGPVWDSSDAQISVLILGPAFDTNKDTYASRLSNTNATPGTMTTAIGQTTQNPAFNGGVPQYQPTDFFRYAIAFKPGTTAVYPVSSLGQVAQLVFQGPGPVNTTLFTSVWNGSSGVINGEATFGIVVPDPVTLSLLGVGAVGLLLRRRRR